MKLIYERIISPKTLERASDYADYSTLAVDGIVMLLAKNWVKEQLGSLEGVYGFKLSESGMTTFYLYKRNESGNFIIDGSGDVEYDTLVFDTGPFPKELAIAFEEAFASMVP